MTKRNASAAPTLTPLIQSDMVSSATPQTWTLVGLHPLVVPEGVEVFDGVKDVVLVAVLVGVLGVVKVFEGVGVSVEVVVSVVGRVPIGVEVSVPVAVQVGVGGQKIETDIVLEVAVTPLVVLKLLDRVVHISVVGSRV